MFKSGPILFTYLHSWVVNSKSLITQLHLNPPWPVSRHLKTKSCLLVTSVSSMAEVTNDNFLFAEVWPLLKWAQFFGTFPFSKERNVSGVYLTPWTKCHMIGLFGAQWSFFLMSIFGLFAYAYLKNPISLEALMQS